MNKTKILNSIGWGMLMLFLGAPFIGLLLVLDWIARIIVLGIVSWTVIAFYLIDYDR